MLQGFRAFLRLLKSEVFTLYYAARDPRAPWYAKVFVGLVVAYAFSPIDLIPDFIPILGFLDEAILLPIGVWLGLRMMPPAVVADARKRAASAMAKKPRILAGALLIVLLWTGFLLLFGYLLYRLLQT